jgi:hypothetical protein
MLEQVIDCEANVFGNLTEQNWLYISALVERNRCASACRVTKLFVGPALADFNEAKSGKNRNNLVGFEDGNIPHGSGDSDVLNPNKLRLQHRLSVLEKHRNYFL